MCFEKVRVESKEKMAEKYRVRSDRDLRSKFLLYLEQRQIDKAEEERIKLVEEKRREMEVGAILFHFYKKLGANIYTSMLKIIIKPSIPT